MPLSEIKLLCSDHEVLLRQITDGEVSCILIPKKTAVNIAREIFKSFPIEALKIMMEDLQKLEDDSDKH
jgi:hypothetical protein